LDPVTGNMVFPKAGESGPEETGLLQPGANYGHEGEDGYIAVTVPAIDSLL
jgi:hypothetical protein